MDATADPGLETKPSWQTSLVEPQKISLLDMAFIWPLLEALL
jgi:hypothetical protein